MSRRLAAALLALACARSPSPPPSPTLAALSRLHDALVAGSVASAADPAALARAELLVQMARMHDIQEERTPTGATEAGWRRLLDDIQARYDEAGVRREFAPSRALLGDGRCVETAAAPLPEALAAVPTPRGSWPPFVASEVRDPMARVAAGAHAGTYRCAGGTGAFQAVFVPGDGGLRVARITTL